MASPRNPQPEDSPGFVPATSLAPSQDFGLPQPRTPDPANNGGASGTFRRFNNRDSFFGGTGMLQMGIGGNRQSAAVTTPTSAATTTGGFGASKQSSRRTRDPDSASITSNSKDYIGGVMSKISNAFSKAKNAVSGKDSSDSLAPPSGKRSKWSLPGSSSRRASVSSNAPGLGIHEESQNSPALSAVASAATSLFSQDVEEGVEGLVSLSVSF
jgi:hypothetical protein